MDINYCQVCGEKLTFKQIGDEGSIGKQLFETAMGGLW